MRWICLVFGTSTLIADPSHPNFDEETDLLLANFDLLPDHDDVMAAAGLACILKHPDQSGVSYHVVAGAYGKQGELERFIGAAVPDFYSLMFGEEGVDWSNAHEDWNAAVTLVSSKVRSTFLRGGKLFVQEAGQSDFTHDVLKVVVIGGIPIESLKDRVVVVQHSNWNQKMTTDAKLDWIKRNTDYRKIDDGNYGGNGTPGYHSHNARWMDEALSEDNPNQFARKVWKEARRVIETHGWEKDRWNNDCIRFGGVDYSDCVENWWIFNLGRDALAKCGNAQFVEEDGIVVVEVESVSETKGWEHEQSEDSETVYYRWAGDSHLERPRETGFNRKRLEYRIRITTPGTYRFRWRSKNAGLGESSVQADSWLRIIGADDFYAKRVDSGENVSIKYPEGGVFVRSNLEIDGASHYGFMSVFSDREKGWSWSTLADEQMAHGIYADFKQAGIYIVEIAGRSPHHAIDKFVLYSEDSWQLGDFENRHLPGDSRCGGVNLLTVAEFWAKYVTNAPLE